MRMSKLGYFSEFILLPPFAVIWVVLAFRASIFPRPAIWVTVYCAGLLSWTLLEYLLHRMVFHRVPIISNVHRRHHERPEELIGTPAWMTLIFGLVGVVYPSWTFLNSDLAAALTAGVITGYLWYVFIHYAAHHWGDSDASYLYRVHTRHSYHHHVSDKGNFGVTTCLWDRLFGTWHPLEASARGPMNHH